MEAMAKTANVSWQDEIMRRVWGLMQRGAGVRRNPKVKRAG